MLNRKHLAKMILIIAIIGIVTQGCATLPKPITAESSMIILRMEFELSGILGTVNRAPDKVYIEKINDTGTVEEELQYGSKSGKYFFFPNLPSGKYRIARGEFIAKGSSSSSGSGHVSVTTSTSLVSRATFSDDIVTNTTCDVKASSIVFMGDFSGKGKIKLFPPGAIGIESATGTRTQEAEKKAYEFMKTDFADSPWIAYIK